MFQFKFVPIHIFALGISTVKFAVNLLFKKKNQICLFTHLNDPSPIRLSAVFNVTVNI